MKERKLKFKLQEKVRKRLKLIKNIIKFGWEGTADYTESSLYARRFMEEFDSLKKSMREAGEEENWFIKEWEVIWTEIKFAVVWLFQVGLYPSMVYFNPAQSMIGKRNLETISTMDDEKQKSLIEDLLEKYDYKQLNRQLEVIYGVGASALIVCAFLYLLSNKEISINAIDLVKNIPQLVFLSAMSSHLFKHTKLLLIHNKIKAELKGK